MQLRLQLPPQPRVLPCRPNAASTAQRAAGQRHPFVAEALVTRRQRPLVAGVSAPLCIIALVRANILQRSVAAAGATPPRGQLRCGVPAAQGGSPLVIALRRAAAS